MNNLGPDELASSERRRKRARERRLSKRDPSLPVIDVGKSLRELSVLTDAIVMQLERVILKDHPLFSLHEDVAMLLRLAWRTFDLIVFVNAEDTRDSTPGYKPSFSVTVLPLVRTVIDVFYTISVLLNDPSQVIAYRVSGFKAKYDALEDDYKRFGKRDEWKGYLDKQKHALAHGLTVWGLTRDQIKKASVWPTLSRYLDMGRETELKKMLRILTLSEWKQYSQLSHGSFAALLHSFPYLNDRRYEAKYPGQLSDRSEREIAEHVSRTAGLMLSMLTEIQMTFRFDGDFDNRLKGLWESMIQTPIVREIFDQRYQKLLSV